MSLVVGIDLGTTNSCIAVYKNNSVKIIESKDLKNTIPSYVYYEPDGKVIVGRKAEEKSKFYPERGVYDSKRFIGIPFNDDHIQVLKENVPFSVVEGEDGECRIEISQNDRQRKIRVEEVSAEILKELKQNAEKFLGEKIVNAVITVPAYFNNAQKQATKDAAKIAGLNVLKLVTEPVAAALAFTRNNELKKEKLVLVYDLGGGTFDVSLMKLNNKKIKTVAIDGEKFLGGRDFDRRLMIHALQYLKIEVKGETERDMMKLRRIKKRLHTECEILKQNLSQCQQVEIELYELEGQNLDMILTRRKFEELNYDYFKKTVKIIDKLLSDQHVNKKKIDEILLVGGSTIIPKIQELVQDYFEGKELNNTVNPDEAVAIGAAIQAALLSDHPAQKCEKYAITDVVPRSLGIEVVGDKSMSVIIERNTKIPCEIKKKYFTHKDNQREATFRVFEGESDDVKENNLLGEFVIQDITQKKKGQVQFDVIFILDLNGILKVMATETLQKKSRELEIALYCGRMTEEEIEQSHLMISRRIK